MNEFEERYHCVERVTALTNVLAARALRKDLEGYRCADEELPRMVAKYGKAVAERVEKCPFSSPLRETIIKMAQPGIGARPFDLEMKVSVFSKLVGLGWQLPDSALVRLCVTGVKRQRQRTPVPFGMGPPSNLALRVRAGMWEWSPRVHFLRPCHNYPGLCVLLGDFRKAEKEVGDAAGDLATNEALSAGGSAEGRKVSVKIRFALDSVVIKFWDVEVSLPEKE